MWNIFSPSKSNPSTPSTPDGATNSSPSSSPYVDSSSRSLRIRGFRQPTSNAEVEALQKEIEALKEELLIKNKTIENLSHKITDLRDELVEKNKALDQLSNNSSVASSYDKKNRQLHTLTPVTHLINDSGRHQTKMNTRGSIATLNALEELKGPDAQKTPIQKLAQKFVKLFDKPTEYIPYLKVKLLSFFNLYSYLSHTLFFIYIFSQLISLVILSLSVVLYTNHSKLLLVLLNFSPQYMFLEIFMVTWKIFISSLIIFGNLVWI